MEVIILVRAKFKVCTITDYGNDQKEVKLIPVRADEGEDSIFGKYTPSGDMRMMILNPEAAAYFEVGASYYVDFSKVE